MTKKEKQQVITFAREGFRKFYDENYRFLSERKFKPGKKTYRNLSSLNKMMEFYTQSSVDYIIQANVIVASGWNGPSSYVQHERVITNFDLSDTSWEDRTRPVLLLNENGKKLRNQYVKYKINNPSVSLMEQVELPEFAKKYLRAEIENATADNMTLWKNTIITALFLYCELGYIHKYNRNSVLTNKEKRALVKCCNYTKDDGKTLMDVTYIEQPIAMLRNLDIIDGDNKLTTEGYKLLKRMQMFREVEASIDDYEEVLEDNLDEVKAILDAQINLQEVDPPDRKKRKSKVSTEVKDEPKNRDFKKAAKENSMTGNLGEKLVLDYEKAKLRSLAINDVDEKVFLTSSKKEKYGNAYPCDIISYDPKTGKEVFIEVKTTRSRINTPFFISAEEVKFSVEHEKEYVLYRVFDALKNGAPKFYKTEGKVEDNFLLENERFIASRYEK